MAKSFPNSLILLRDGTSQPMRQKGALEPSFAKVDERSTADLIAFAREYGKELIYFDAADRPDGDWSALLDPSVEIDDLARLVDDPEGIPGERVARACRPHVTLFLTFLKLLQRAQDHLNTLTRRHLEFYYGDVLGMVRRPPAPDRASVIVRLGSGVESALLPAGTLLDAGKDSEGKALAYRTDRDVVLGRAQIARLSSVHVERRITTIPSAREEHAEDKDAGLLAALRIALGDPGPGDPLPAYKGARPVDMALLRELYALVVFSKTHLFLELFELSTLIRLLRKREDARGEWNLINGYLKDAARARLGNPSYPFAPADPKNFAANLALAVGGTPDFGSLADIVSVDDLYAQRFRPDASDFIKHSLHFIDVGDFVNMMQIKLRSDSEWREINRILEAIGRRKRSDENYHFLPADPSAFEQNLDAAVGPVSYSGLGVSTIHQYQEEIAHIEDAFYMPAEDFAYMMAVHEAAAPTEKEWSRVDELLADAHERKVYKARRARLKQLGKGASSSLEGLRLVLREALGQENAPDDVLELIELLRDVVTSDSDIELLQSMAEAASSPPGITDPKWDRIVAIAEPAQRLSEGFEKPAAEEVEWLDIYPYEDATAVTASIGPASDSSNPRWKTFGAASLRTLADSPSAPVFGWAIGSPILSLREGQRTVVLTLAFEAAGFHAASIAAALAKGPFSIELSTASGYREVTAVTVAPGDYKTLSGVARALPAPLPALKLKIELGEDFDPIVAPPAPPGASALTAAGCPVLRIMLRPVWDAARGRFIALYEPLRDLVLSAAHLKVEARGMTSVAVENERSVLDSKKPFEPFGVSPSVGSRFYVGHPELIQKRLDSLRFHIEWMKAPADLQAHYAGYGISPDFRARITLHDRAREQSLVGAAPLFASTSPRDPHMIEVLDVGAALSASSPQYTYGEAPAAAAAGSEVSAWSRYLVWELTPISFQHSAYPQVAAMKAGELSAALAARAASPSGPTVNVAAYQINAPYTPTVKRLTVDYSSSVEVRLAAGSAIGAGDDRVYHIHPFGDCEITAEGEQSAQFLPRYDDYQGELYVGIRDVHPPQTLCMLVKTAEGSADADLEPALVEWSYLSGDRWISMHHGNILSDGTRGLLDTGIIEMSIERAEPSTRMPGDLYWLRAAVRRDARSVSDLLTVHTQAVSATFVDRENAPDHYDAPLPRGSITKLVEPLRGIAAVEQPYTSYGGRIAERDAELYARVSERLRHKDRGLSLWDYERLILERFPQIYKVKCLPANMAEAPDEPGKVAIIVIPDVRAQIPFDPFDAKAPAATLAEIEAYLADKIPPEARIDVRNAIFIAVKVRAEVRFMPGCDEGFYKKKLGEEISRFLSPWAYEDGVDIAISNRIYANSIVDFIDRRPYIDHVAGITLFTGHGESFVAVKAQGAGGAYVSTDRPDGVLVAARQHEIDTSWQARAAQKAAADAARRATVAEQTTGIGHVHIGLDLIIKNQMPPEMGIESMLIEIDFQVD